MSYDHLLRTVLSRLPGAGSDAVKLEISNAMHEFCMVTGVWRETIEQNLLEGRTKYVLAPKTGCVVINHIVRLQVDDRVYSPIGGDEVGFQTWHGVFKVQERQGSIELAPAPTGNVAKGIKAVVTLRPIAGDVSMPCELIDMYREQLVDGALERLFGHPSKPYSNDDKAMYHHRRFRAAITRARRTVRGGNAHNSPPWVFPQIAPGRSRRGARTYGS